MVSIVVPVYNAASFIAETVESVISQTYADWELILVDDCSVDGSVTLIKDLISIHPDRQIRLILQECNKGVAAARNRGIDEARGRYIAFLDADDIWLPDKLTKEMHFMRKSDAAFVFSAYAFGDENAKPTGRAVHVPGHLDYKAALSRTIIFTSTVLLDREKISRKLIHMPRIPSEDTATWWRILKSGITAYGLDEILVIYRRSAGSLSRNKGKAVKRIWNLYRRVAGLSVPSAAYHMVFWAWRASMRRLLPARK